MAKIMIVNTSYDHFEGTTKPTGLWLGELVHFYDHFNNSDHHIDVFSIQGGHTPIDPVSLGRLMLDKVTKQYYQDEQFMKMLAHSRPLSEAVPEQYDVIYFTGGHGVMFDFPENIAIQHAIKTIYKHGGIVSAVCHGVSALLNVTMDSGKYFIDGKHVTGFSNTEEVLANRNNIVPFKLESELKNHHARYSKALVPFRPYVKVDNRLVTGQNPQSPKQVAEAVEQLLNK
ncbi:type 1 glutamine amidotransferase domain-containing protein [Staphylococcus simiae]|uniref:type 1 glutamine amidotransferase domain-containing protein n=1 Tax=Staphylococcus simiae TaxID=308354 RepID=UPI001A978B95|nr:type 1 glutamine amidotransferase domain-containing protein [Staphylococcus simiae]MBO1198523.1 type 1 glutamine amidotransferase domain-containing protein [Staphylococcus simiae]MBO1200679.1 type 1 glutamine amidotransferase domain-containing protein [Staphylococcus simiae]MBO1202929.1 type 1 glutamine amidotransferase domain-containing protein [Staphylococcus simiae]MBO1210514.1 type 1 glutamine amidotransferase domain-containing protein [Staphylococcus simiae]MBO1228995.1 type 1 glutamin